MKTLGLECNEFPRASQFTPLVRRPEEHVGPRAREAWTGGDSPDAQFHLQLIFQAGEALPIVGI